MAEKVPRVVPGVDIRKFKLDPMDGFLLTRIDGRLGPRELARETGLPDFSVARSLEKLEKLAIIQLVDPSAPAAPPPPAPPAEVERKSAVAQYDAGLLAPKYDPKELEEPADLPPEQKKRVLDFYYRLDDLDHYTLLGVTREADKKGVKRAYFELAALFHPDRYFKKNLGSFKPKMEALFNRITEAHDALVDPAKRSEYDAYLAEVATTRGMEAMLERALAESAQAAAAQPAPVAASMAPPTAVSRPPSGPSPEELRARKEALARRLTGGRPTQPSRPPEDRPNPLVYSSSSDAVDALKRRYEDRVESAAQASAQRYITAGEDALTKNDLVAASTAFSLATKFAPEDQALAMRAQEIKNRADATLAASYLKQAEYEERQGHWTEAARSWVKLAKVQDDAHTHARAANAILKAPDGDLREASEHAKRAIGLDPKDIEHHVTLVEIYLKAGLTTSARRACEAATQLDPKHAGLQALMKRAGK